MKPPLAEHAPKLHSRQSVRRPMSWKPAVPIEESVRADGIVCLYDGVQKVNLTNYLRARYGVTPEQYREEFGFPDDYPMMVTPSARQVRLWRRQTRFGLAFS